MARDLDAAFSGGELYAVYQPQIALETGAVVAAEALCRWRHPTRGLVPPDQFIPLAEESGLIQLIGQFMLDQSLSALRSWHDMGRPIGLSVNVSPVQLRGDAFVDYLSTQVRRNETPADALTIEITESRPVLELTDIVERLETVRRLGVGVALDDYGSGHASAVPLERLPVTELKIDKSLIQNGDAAADVALAKTIDRARQRGLRVVAEGVETTAQLTLATSLGCERAQGYLLGMPMERSEFDAMLAA